MPKSVPGRDRAPERSRSSGALVRGVVCQPLRLAGTAAGSVRFAVRARVTRAEVALVDDVPAAALLFLPVAFLAGFGASTASSSSPLAASAAASTEDSACAATLVALAAVFCATEVTSLEA